MKNRLVIIFTICTVVVVGITGVSYAWYNNALSVSAEEKGGIVSGKMNFSLNGNPGIPGGSIKISDKNAIAKDRGSTDLAFKVEYSVTDQYSLKLIKSLELKNSGTALRLEKDKNSADTHLIYYGYIDSTSDMDLGNLFAEFNIVKNGTQNKPYSVETKFTYCQPTKASMMDILGCDKNTCLNILNQN